MFTKREQLKSVKSKLDELNNVMKMHKDEKRMLEEQAISYKKKLERAALLINGLGGEKVRWLSEADNLTIEYETLVGDILLCSGIVTYMGSFTASYRQVSLLNSFISIEIH